MMKKVRIISLLILLFATCVMSAEAQQYTKKAVVANKVQKTQEELKVDTDTVIVAPKTKLETADSLYRNYEGLLSQGAACDSMKLYKVLNETFAGCLDVLKDSTATASYIDVKKKLRGMHPKLCEGGIYCSQKKDVPLAVDLLEKYVMLPKNPFFKDEMFSFPPNIADLIYFVATSKYNTRDFATAITLFNEYLNSQNKEKHEQKVYLYLAKSYRYADYGEYEIYTLMKGVQKYPKDVNLYKEIIEYHIKTRNSSQADYYLIVYEKLNPNPLELLELKAKVAELKEDFYQFMLLSEQLYNADVNNFNTIVLRGRSCYNYVIDEMKKGRTDISGNPVPELTPYLDNAAKMFEIAVQKQPKDKQYYDALIDTYSLLGRKEDAVAVAEKLKVLMGFTDDSLLAKKETSPTQVKEPVKAASQMEAGNDNLLRITSYGAPVFSSFALDYVNENMTVWLKKDTYETTAAYNERTTGIEREKKVRELANEAKKRYIRMYAGNVANQAKGFRLVDYDADNETYLIKYAMGNMLIRVPLKDNQAQNFKSDWGMRCVKPTNAQFDVIADTLCITGLTFSSSNSGLSYEYSINNQLSYVKANVKIDPTPISGFDMLSMFNKNSKKVNGQTIIETDTDLADDGKKSDVDIDIPVIPDSLRNENMFALIISNENYDNTGKVHYAINDGNTFKEYCKNVLGIPNRNIEFQVDVSYGKMMKIIETFAETLKAVGPEAKGVVYYSGHGVPNMETSEAFFLPKDGIPESLEFTIPINWLYTTLGSTGANRVDVYLDCCFSGNSKSGTHLYAARGTVIKPEENAPQGNMIVMSACSGSETAFPYGDKRHGMFTYFLLKKLKETSGNVTMGELAEYVKTNVHKNSMINNKKSQTPNVMSSGDLSATWKMLNVR